jgi:lipopolysaccharide/colanic/teichoic acid biosynthesis glycosyltransferase
MSVTGILKPPHLLQGRRRSIAAAVGRSLSALFALALLVLGSPLFLLTGLLVFLGDGRPILYRGLRLGKDRRPFTIYKFRTLRVGAQNVIGGKLLSQLPGQRALIIRFGGFLRDTRLDELPQLINIIKGDLNFIGQRPLRHEVYESHCWDIPGYDRCFSTKPGLVGPSQIFTPHCSPKRLRSLLDAQSLKRDASLHRVRLILIAAVAAGVKIAGRLSRRAHDKLHRLVLRIPQRRGEGRERPRGAEALICWDADGPRSVAGEVMDISETAVRVRCAEIVPADHFRMVLQVRVVRKGRSRVKRAACFGQVLQRRGLPGAWDIVISFRPVSRFGSYIVHQYLLRRSFARPFSYPRARRTGHRSHPAHARNGVPCQVQ